MEQSAKLCQNTLLASFPQYDMSQWERHLELIALPLRKVLYESGVPQPFVYFPTTAIISLLHVLNDGSSAEVAVVGFEGLVGAPVLMGGGSTPSYALVESAGMGYRIPAHVFQTGVERSTAVMRLLLRFIQALIAQMAQTAVCNRHHSIEKQFVRRLLLISDRRQCNELVMTQQLMSKLIGVRREGVTEAALHLQSEGLIRYSRGHISVLNRPLLEGRACECYRVVKKEYDRLLPVLEAQDLT